MPSPIGHALGGLAFGWLLERRRGPMPAPTADHIPRHSARVVHQLLLVARDPWTLGFALLGALADVDFLVGAHSAQTHSVGAALTVFLVAAVWGGHRDFRRGAACAAAYGSHVLFDWMGNDTTAPIGVMALWPFAEGYYQSDLHVFEAISRRYWLPNFWMHNALAVLREIALLIPAVLLVWWFRQRLTGWSKTGETQTFTVVGK